MSGFAVFRLTDGGALEPVVGSVTATLDTFEAATDYARKAARKYPQQDFVVVQTVLRLGCAFELKETPLGPALIVPLPGYRA